MYTISIVLQFEFIPSNHEPKIFITFLVTLQYFFLQYLFVSIKTEKNNLSARRKNSRWEIPKKIDKN